MSLKPCPFCGGDAKVCFENGDYGYTPDAASVVCAKCGAHTVKIYEKQGWIRGRWRPRSDIREDVARLWNGRV